MLFNQLIKNQRKALGISQVELASQSGLSLPTIQKIEAGLGNPSLDTLEALLPPLGYSFHFQPRSADWEYLQACGLPLSDYDGNLSKTLKLSHLDLAKFILEIRIALVELFVKREHAAEDSPYDQRSRKIESLLALILGLKLHYPSIYEMIGRSEILSRIEEQLGNPKLIKLKRLALSGVSRFL